MNAVKILIMLFLQLDMEQRMVMITSLLRTPGANGGEIKATSKLDKTTSVVSFKLESIPLRDVPKNRIQTDIVNYQIFKFYIRI